MNPESCFHCGSTADPYFSRVEPMGNYCPDCGETADPVLVQVDADTLLGIRDAADELIDWSGDVARMPQVPPKFASAVLAASERLRTAIAALPPQCPIHQTIIGLSVSRTTL